MLDIFDPNLAAATERSGSCQGLRYAARVQSMAGLRPLERRVVKLASEGVVPAEIGRRFNRSEDYVERVLELASVPGRHARQPRAELRPIERRLLRWREEGVDAADLADRFRRGPEHIERVLALADYKRQRS